MRTVVVVQTAMGTGRLEGPVCTAHHVWMPPTPGRQDAGWAGIGDGCFHLADRCAAFDSTEEAFTALERDALPQR